MHFEMPVEDPKMAQKFYEKLFGWKFEFYKEMEYYGIKTKDKDTDMGINGGMMKRKMPDQRFMNYVTVPSVDKTLKMAKDNGAKICMEKMPIGDGAMGFIGAFIDPDGNMIGVHEAGKNRK